MATTVEKEILSREKVHGYLNKAIWPMARAILIDVAKSNQAPQTFLEVLGSVPNQLYVSEEDLWREITRYIKPAGE